MKALLVAAVVWATTVQPPEQKPEVCPTAAELNDKFKTLEPIMTESGAHFLLGVKTIKTPPNKETAFGVLMAPDADGRYCTALSIPDGVWQKIARKYKSFLI